MNSIANVVCLWLILQSGIGEFPKDVVHPFPLINSFQIRQDSSGLAARLPSYRKAIVLISLSEVCMLSQYYSKEIERLRADWQQKGIEFVGVFPNPFSSEESMKAFAAEQNLHFPLIRDEKAIFSKKYSITKTPEILLLDTAFRVLYQGPVDDFYVAIGRHKTRKTKTWLEDALKSIDLNQPIPIKKTPAVGCIIDFSLWER
jgi:hypothetical protein